MGERARGSASGGGSASTSTAVIPLMPSRARPWLAAPVSRQALSRSGCCLSDPRRRSRHPPWGSLPVRLSRWGPGGQLAHPSADGVGCFKTGSRLDACPVRPSACVGAAGPGPLFAACRTSGLEVDGPPRRFCEPDSFSLLTSSSLPTSRPRRARVEHAQDKSWLGWPRSSGRLSCANRSGQIGG